MPFLAPSGPFGIGSIVHCVIDGGRPSHLLGSVPGRRLTLKCWYPAELSTGTRPEPIWAELRDDGSVPLPVRALLKCMGQRTSTYPGAPFSRAARDSQLVLYNHGLVSFAAENTSLAEELASHGYTVVAIQHVEQLFELRALSAGQSADKRRADAQRADELRRAAGAERARLAMEYYEGSTNTNRIVVERSIDTSLVLNRITDVLEKIPGGRAHSIDTVSAHLVGFSVGGAVSAETATRDRRAVSVVNLDGGMYGTFGQCNLRLPYLMMYSAANEGMNDTLLPSQAQCLAPSGTAHLNYHDVAGLVPGLRLMGAVGRADPKSFLSQRNRAVLSFLSAQGA